MTIQTIFDLQNNECTTGYIEIDAVRIDFQMNLMFYLDKVFGSNDFKQTSHYEGIFNFYENGWKGLKTIIDQNGLTKKEMGRWFDDYINSNKDEFSNYQIKYKWKRGNFKELLVTIDKKEKEEN